MKFGGEFHADQVNAHPIAQFNGSFVFSGTETGVDFADFLIGVPSQYNQSQLNPFYARNKYVGLFAQDSWHVLPNLTLNYGLRWDRIAPWSEKYNQISTFVAGAQSVVFPGAPPGILYPGDRAGGQSIPNTLAPIGNLSFCAARGHGLVATGRRRQLPGKDPWSAGHDQHSGKRGKFLHRDRCAFDRRPGCERSLRHYLYQPRASALRDAIHHRGQRSEQRPAVSL